MNINHIFWTYTKKLLIVYSLWSIVYIAIEAFQNMGEEFQLITFLKHIVVAYFVNGSYYHLWFFPALFFSIIIVTFFTKIKKLNLLAYISLILYIIGCLGCSYFEIGNQIPLIRDLINFSKFTLIRRVLLMGLPFFTIGYFINKIQSNNKKNLSNKCMIYSMLFVMMAFIVEILIVNYFNIQKNIIMTILLYPLLLLIILLLLRNPMMNKEELGRNCRGMANFVYYSHPIFILLFKQIIFVKDSNTLIFIFVLAITSLIGYIIVKVNNKLLNKLIY